MQRRKVLSILWGLGHWACWGANQPSLWVVGTRVCRRLSLPISSTVTINLKGSPQTAFLPWALESLLRPGRNEFIGWQEVALQGRPVTRVQQGKNEEGMTVGDGRVLPCHIGTLTNVMEDGGSPRGGILQRTKTCEPVTLALGYRFGWNCLMATFLWACLQIVTWAGCLPLLSPSSSS